MAENKKGTAKKATPAKKKEKKGFLPFWKAPLFVKVVVFVLALLALLYGLYRLSLWGIANYYAGKINYQTAPATNKQNITTPLSDAWQPPESWEWTGEDQHGILNADNLPTISDTKDVTNILLLASDTRGQEEWGRSDTMILASINKKTGKIILTSFLRDTLAKYPQYPENPIYGTTGYDKLTHAYAYSGPELTMAVFAETFNIQVDYYASVDFHSFVDIIDCVGGVDLYLTADEILFINEAVNDEEVLAMVGEDKKSDMLPVADGTYHLNGMQALRHARNRYTNGDDRMRTERQRIIIDALIQKARTLNVVELNHALETILSQITTNMPKNRVVAEMQKVPQYIFYDVESCRLPLEGEYTLSGWNFVFDLQDNMNYLYEMIYGEKPPVS